MVIGYIIGIIWGLYFDFSIVLLYIPICFFIVLIKDNKKKKRFKAFSIKRYFRYVKLFLTKHVFLLILFSSIISNTILFCQEDKYKNLYREENIQIEGIIISNKEEREYKNRYKIKVLKANNSSTYNNTHIYIETKKDITFFYGDKVILQGEFRKGSEQRNTGGFDYQLYLKSIKIFGILSVEKYNVISSDNVNYIEKIINNMKLKINDNIERLLKDEEQQIMKGLILGDTTILEEKLKEKFQIANISHVLAVSGMHIVYIMMLVENSLKKCCRKRHIKYIVIIAVLIYMDITGFSSSIIRAGIMGIMNILAFLLYRKNDIWNSIAISLMIILIQNPYAILNVGLQLSYLGTIGIVLFNKNIRKYLDNLNFIKNNIIIKRSKYIFKIVVSLEDMLSVTFSAQIMILPIMIYHFNMLGIYFLLTNILVSIIIGYIMFIAIIFVFVSFANFQISQFIVVFLSIGIKGLIKISYLSDLPFSKIYIVTPSIYFIILYYVVILILNKLYEIYTSKNLNNTQIRVKNLIALAKYRMHNKKSLIITMIVVIITVNLVKNILILHDLEINFIDVGQGDSCFIITPNRKTILIDGGGSTSNTFDIGKKTVIPYLLDKGYSKIDYLFISHFDQDHVGGVLSVMEELKIGQVFISKQKEENENYKKFVKIVEEKKIKVYMVKAGDIISIEDIKINILWPIDKHIEENQINNNAMVMKLSYRKFSILFTGDIEEVAEKSILEFYKENLQCLKSEILKVAHHGSKSSSTEQFLYAVDSKVAIISVGENNTFGHPNSEVLERIELMRYENI